MDVLVVAGCAGMSVTDLLVLSVLQPYGVVRHAQHCDDEVDQSKDAVEPQKAVPVRHKNTAVIQTSIDSQCASQLCAFSLNLMSFSSV